MQKLPHCESFYRALDKRLEQKMAIDEIAKELCNHTKDPRRNMIIDIKEYKGEDWLIANAEWLGYQIQKKREEAIAEVAIRCSSDLLRSKANVSDNDMQKDILAMINETVYGDKNDTRKDVKEKSKLALILEDAERKEKDNINDQKGISIWGWLAEDTPFFSVRHMCNIRPYIDEGYYFVSLATVINLDFYKEEEKEEEEDQKDENVKTTLCWNSYAYPSVMIDMVVDSFFYPREFFDNLKKFLEGKLKESPDLPKIEKSQDPSWKWSCHLGDRCKENWFEQYA